MAQDKKLIYASAARRAVLKADPKLAYCIDNIEPVEVEEVTHGEWLFDSGTEQHFCSACSEYALSVTYEKQVADYDWEENLVFRTEPTTKEFLTDYCPNCGAKMDGDGNG